MKTMTDPQGFALGATGRCACGGEGPAAAAARCRLGASCRELNVKSWSRPGIGHISQKAMKRFLPAFLIVLCANASGQDNRFTKALLDQDGGFLRLHRADGSQSAAPKLEEQDAFGKPAVASNRRYVGWLALFPNQGASYSQPLYLVVMDTSNRIQRFRGDFGMVFSWCFSPRGTEVVYQSSFPHGATPVEFEMRRISDGRLLRRFKLPESESLQNEEPAWHQQLPSWTRCAAPNHVLASHIVLQVRYSTTPFHSM